MPYVSSLLDKSNALNANSTASDLYLYAKAMAESGYTTVPKNLVQAVRARVLDPATTDPNELAYLLKLLKFFGGNALLGFFYDPQTGLVRTLEPNVNTHPLQGSSDLILPTNTVMMSTPGTYNFVTLYGSQIPSWYKDTTILRVRIWGAGGAGGNGMGRHGTGGSGGGGGGYSEGLISWGTIKANPNFIVGRGGNRSGSSHGGGSSAFNLLAAGGGGPGTERTSYDAEVGAYLQTIVPGGAGGAGSGAGALFVAAGGSGGGSFTGGAEMNGIAGSGGGAAGGPWGGGKNGGGSTTAALTVGGHGGGGTAGIGQTTTGQVGGLGGASAPYSTIWMTSFLQSNLGGSPLASSATVAFGVSPGCGGSGQYFDASKSYPSRNGGAFGGGGGACAGTTGNPVYLHGGNGGIAAGGGGGGGHETSKGGNGGDGLVIIEFFT